MNFPLFFSFWLSKNIFLVISLIFYNEFLFIMSSMFLNPKYTYAQNKHNHFKFETKWLPRKFL